METGLLAGSSRYPGSILGRVCMLYPSLRPILPSIRWVPGMLSLRMKAPGREAHYSHLSSAEVNVECCHTFTPTFAFMVYARTAFHTLYRYYLGVNY
jgi:hypothetical protein